MNVTLWWTRSLHTHKKNKYTIRLLWSIFHTVWIFLFFSLKKKSITFFTFLIQKNCTFGLVSYQKSVDILLIVQQHSENQGNSCQYWMQAGVNIEVKQFLSYFGAHGDLGQLSLFVSPPTPFLLLSLTAPKTTSEAHSRPQSTSSSEEFLNFIICFVFHRPSLPKRETNNRSFSLGYPRFLPPAPPSSSPHRLPIYVQNALQLQEETVYADPCCCRRSHSYQHFGTYRGMQSQSLVSAPYSIR